MRKILLWLLRPFFDAVLSVADSTLVFSPALAWYVRAYHGAGCVCVVVRVRPYADGSEHYAIVFGHGLDGKAVQLAQVAGRRLGATGLVLVSPTAARIAADYRIARKRFRLTVEPRRCGGMECLLLRKPAP